MSPQPRGTTIEIHTLSEQEAHKAIRETYTDADAALKWFGAYVTQREKALKAFDGQLNKDEQLAAAFSRDPLGTLRERNLLGPLDEINIEGLHNPWWQFPWPLPWCRWVCRIECHWEVVWVCVRILGFRICWPRFVLRCRWVCRLVCNF